MSARPSVLFLCTGNSARSQMAEAILRHLTRGAFEVESAGSRPKAEIHPLAREAVRSLLGVEMDGQRPKPVEDFLSRKFDYVVTVCDRAAETCPAFPGAEVIRWSLPDPAEGADTDESKRRAFAASAKDLLQRVRLWLSLPAVAARLTASARSS